MAFVSSRSTDEYHDLIDDLTIENRTLRQQRDEYGRQLIIMQDQVAQLEICTKCEEAHRDAYASRRELAKLQSSINAAESKTFEQQHAGLCATRGDPACESTEADGPGDRELETSASAVVVAGMIERLTYYKNAFSKLQVDNKDLRCKIESFRIEDAKRNTDSQVTNIQLHALKDREDVLMNVKTERNSYRSKANSLTKELVHLEIANSKRTALIADLRLELFSRRGEIKNLKRKLSEQDNRRSRSNSGGSIFSCISQGASKTASCQNSPRIAPTNVRTSDSNS